MTKSTITRERLVKIKSWREIYGAGSNVMLPAEEAEALALIALAAMDSEPVKRVNADQMHHVCLEANRHLDKYGAMAKEVNKLLGCIPAQPASEYPEVLPCPVLLEPGLRFGKGIKTSTMLAALARRAVHESDMAALSPEERAEFQARIEDFKALIAQPVPVVPQDVLEALQKVARIRLDLNEFDGDRRGIADCLGDAEEALIEVVNRRAAMLKAQPQNAPQNIPEIIPGWIPVSEQMPEVGDIVLTAMGGVVNVGEMECSAANCRFFTSVISGRELPATHWMQLPAGPREVKGE
ncbi:DUF551 domain-containing protein [Klebsiella variicola]